MKPTIASLDGSKAAFIVFCASVVLLVATAVVF